MTQRFGKITVSIGKGVELVSVRRRGVSLTLFFEGVLPRDIGGPVAQDAYGDVPKPSPPYRPRRKR